MLKAILMIISALALNTFVWLKLDVAAWHNIPWGWAWIPGVPLILLTWDEVF